MTTAIAPLLQTARLAAMLSGMGVGVRVRIHGGMRPAPGAASDAPLLAEVPLSNPPGIVSEGRIALTPADPAGVLVRTTGEATWARVVGLDEQGSQEIWLLDCDVSGPSGAGDWQIAREQPPDNALEGASPTRLYEGGTFLLGAVTLD